MKIESMHGLDRPLFKLYYRKALKESYLRRKICITKKGIQGNEKDLKHPVC